MRVLATSYCLTGTTATGVRVRQGIVATDPGTIPLGTRMYIPGYGYGVAADTGAWIKGKHIDLWMSRCSRSIKWGAREVTIQILGAKS